MIRWLRLFRFFLKVYENNEILMNLNLLTILNYYNKVYENNEILMNLNLLTILNYYTMACMNFKRENLFLNVSA
jgi:hypothetical protein